MKKAILSLVVFAAPLMADHSHVTGNLLNKQVAIRTSRELVQVLASVGRESEIVANRAAAAGHAVRARRFRDLGFRAERLSFDLRRLVVRRLVGNASLLEVRRNLESLRGDFRALQTSYDVIQQVPRNIEDLVRRGRILYPALKHELGLI